MAQSILIFDFGKNEEAAQQARHKIGAWTQGGRLGKKIVLKFDRQEPQEQDKAVKASSSDSGQEETVEAASSKKKAEKSPGGKKSASASGKKQVSENGGDAIGRVQLLVRLDFSDHEKLTHQRWLDRFSTEEPFKSAKGDNIRHNDATFAQTAERFDSLA